MILDLDPMSAPDPTRRDALDFNNSSRTSHADQAVPLGGVPRALREAAELAGLDPVASLYNEALRYAQEKHLRLARERLQMLLCMAPDDGEARLMLAQVFVGEQRWSEALAALDDAASCGVEVPISLRRAVEDHLRDRSLSDETTGSGRPRDPGEVKALRLEARRLRSENAQQQGQITQLEREVRKWAWSTAGVSGLTILFIVASLVRGVGGAVASADEAAPPPVPVQPDVVEAAVEAPAPAPPAPNPPPAPVAAPAPEPTPAPVAPAAPVDVEAAVRDAIAAVPAQPTDDVTVVVADGRAKLTGAVLTARQRRAYQQAAAQVPGVSKVDVSGVELLVRSRGALHVVRKGDTLTGLASEYYGNSGYSKKILEANGVQADSLRIGQKLTIPPIAR